MKSAIAIFGAWLLLAGLAGGAATGAAPAATTPPPVPDNYVLGPGDQIEITVFGEPDLTKVVMIKPDGFIDLPLVKLIKAAGRTAAQLEGELTRQYSRFLKRPSVSVLVQKFRMDPVYVMGEVTKPGRYDMTYDMTILDALTVAGGTTDKANLDGVQISRVENGKSTAIPVKMNQMIQGKGPPQNVKLQPGDLVYVPKRGLNLLEIINNIGILRMVLGL